MSNPNRIENTTVANAEENKRLAPITKEDVFTVPPFAKVAILAVLGGLSAALPFVTGIPLIVVSVALGIVTTVGVGVGMNVGTPKK